MQLVPHFLCADFISRPDKESMTQQTLMELLISNFDDKAVFRNPDGLFTDIAQWEGVTLNSNEKVIDINWEHMNTYGIVYEHQLPQKGGSIDFKWLPSTASHVIISMLDLSGSLSTSELPLEIQMLDISNNVLEGSLELIHLPRQMFALWASRNKLSGSLILQDLPPGMKSFVIATNSFSGMLSFGSLPQTLFHLYLDNNSFSGTLELTSLPESLKHLRLENNHFDKHEILIVPIEELPTLVVDRDCFTAVHNMNGENLTYEDFMVAKTVRLIWPDEDPQ